MTIYEDHQRFTDRHGVYRMKPRGFNWFGTRYLDLLGYDVKLSLWEALVWWWDFRK